MNYNPVINFVVALGAEANPLVDRYKLQRVHAVNSFEVYRNEDFQLIVSGIGKINSATATGFLAGLTDVSPLQAWLNVGIAGGSGAQFGNAVMINELLDRETGKRYYPPLSFDIDLQQACLITVGEPEEKYRQDALYDMEATGFFAAANRFSSVELVQCCKIVSDNRENSINEINKASVISLVKSRMGELDRVVEALRSTIKIIEPDCRVDREMERLVGQYHFSQSQLHTLKTYLQNWFALNDESELPEGRLNNSKNSRQFLETFGRLINESSIHY